MYDVLFNSSQNIEIQKKLKVKMTEIQNCQLFVPKSVSAPEHLQQRPSEQFPSGEVTPICKCLFCWLDLVLYVPFRCLFILLKDT